METKITSNSIEISGEEFLKAVDDSEEFESLQETIFGNCFVPFEFRYSDYLKFIEDADVEETDVLYIKLKNSRRKLRIKQIKEDETEEEYDLEVM